MSWTRHEVIIRPNGTRQAREVWRHPHHGIWIRSPFRREDGTLFYLWWRIDRLTPDGMPTGGLRELPRDDDDRGGGGCGCLVLLAVGFACVCAFIWHYPLQAIAFALIF